MGKKNRKNRNGTTKDNGLTVAWCPLCEEKLASVEGLHDGVTGAWYYCEYALCGQYMEFVEAGAIVPNADEQLTFGYYGGAYYHNGAATTGFKGTTITDGRTCHHWREPVRVGENWLTVSAWSDKPKKEADELPYPDMGVYVADLWMRHFKGFVGVGIALPSKYKALICDWPDFGVVAVNNVRWLILFIDECFKNGMDVDIGCHGAHGRTGTLLACLIAFYEQCTSSQAISAVHQRHCAKAVETAGQANLIRAFCGEPEKAKVWNKAWTLYLSGYNVPKPELKARMEEE